MKKILFTGGGGAGNEAIWRLLSAKYELFFADCNVNNIDPQICQSRKVKIPQANHPSFLDSLIKVTNDLEIDFLVPSVDEELSILSKKRDLFDCQIFTPDYSYISEMLDKYLCANTIKQAGFTAPQTYYVNDWKKLNFPMIIKPKSGRGSRGVMVISSEEELDAYRVFNKFEDTDLIVQELINGQEYTVLVSANKDQELNGIIPIRVDQKKGITISATLEMNEVILNYVKAFHNNFPTRCIYNIQCILTSTGQVYPFEVNPRISTTFCMSLAGGFDPFYMYDQINIKGLFDINKEVSIKRFWKNSIVVSG